MPFLFVGNDTLEAKNIQNVDGWAQGMANGHRWRRSLKIQKVRLFRNLPRLNDYHRFHIIDFSFFS